MLIRAIFIFLILSCSITGYSHDIPKVKKKRLKDLIFFRKQHSNHSKVVAATFDITLGLFGVHRLYLGTKPIVPMIYAITLGGGGFLVVADLAVILFTKDLEKMSDNGHILMWNINEHPEDE